MLVYCFVSFLFFKQMTAYELGMSDWSSDVCSSDLEKGRRAEQAALGGGIGRLLERARKVRRVDVAERCGVDSGALEDREYVFERGERGGLAPERGDKRGHGGIGGADASGREGRAGEPRNAALAPRNRQRSGTGEEV